MWSKLGLDYMAVKKVGLFSNIVSIAEYSKEEVQLQIQLHKEL